MISRRIENEYILQEDFCILRIHSKTYGDRDYIINTNDTERVKLYHWNIMKCWNKKSNAYPHYYAATNSGKILLHRYIINATKGSIVDHINRDISDTRKNNLRECTKSKNKLNSKMQLNNTSGVTGVYRYPNNKGNRWVVLVRINKKQTTLGYFDKFEDAVKVRKAAELLYYGEPASLEHTKYL